MLRRILLLMSGNAFRSVMLFIRTIIVIRLISVADVGIASTFMIAVSVVQMLSISASTSSSSRTTAATTQTSRRRCTGSSCCAAWRAAS